MTVSDLIDYLGQFAPETIVVLDTEQANNLPAEGDFIQLDTLDYQLEEPK